MENRMSLVNAFLNDVFSDGLIGKDVKSREVVYAPATDIYEKEGNVFIETEMPGVSKENIIIDLENGCLKLQGKSVVERKSDSVKSIYVERESKTFKRSIEIPSHVNVDKVNASFDNGILTVSYPKSDPVKTSNRIQIN